ncbi:MAG TPA: hypothetical protein PLH03_04605 [Methylophilaceae bacterium]|nr:hypothetical protein [Methylophilaceae bacterium]
MHDPASSARGLGSVERKIRDEIRIGEYLDAASRKAEQEVFALDASSRLTGYAQTIDSNVSRAFLYRNWRLVGLVYHNHSNGSMLLLEINYF